VAVSGVTTADYRLPTGIIRADGRPSHPPLTPPLKGGEQKAFSSKEGEQKFSPREGDKKLFLPRKGDYRESSLPSREGKYRGISPHPTPSPASGGGAEE